MKKFKRLSDKLKTKGFTLVEVMVILVVVSIIAAFAAPEFRSFGPTMRLDGAARDLYGTIMQTKTEAMKRNTNCVLAFNQQVGLTTYSYVLFEDSDRNAMYSSTESIVKMVEFWPDGVEPDLTKGSGSGFSLPFNGDTKPVIAFGPRGLPVPVNSVSPGGTIFLINNRGKEKSVIFNNAGNISLQ